MTILSTEMQRSHSLLRAKKVEHMSNEIIKEINNEFIKEMSHEFMKGTSNELIKEINNEFIKEMSHEFIKGTSNELIKEINNEFIKEMSHEFIKEMSTIQGGNLCLMRLLYQDTTGLLTYDERMNVLLTYGHELIRNTLSSSSRDPPFSINNCINS